ncbi:MAG: hypothetical protein P4L84_11820, partial [Isosphaeraceae bacterium]|nr:hypothetical protein [Isosphaeraceae bacterium]
AWVFQISHGVAPSTMNEGTLTRAINERHEIPTKRRGFSTRLLSHVSNKAGYRLSSDINR